MIVEPPSAAALDPAAATLVPPDEPVSPIPKELIEEAEATLGQRPEPSEPAPGRRSLEEILGGQIALKLGVTLLYRRGHVPGHRRAQNGPWVKVTTGFGIGGLMLALGVLPSGGQPTKRWAGPCSQGRGA